MTQTTREFGRRLKRLRMERKLTRYALAKRAGISQSYARKLEVGRSDPSLGMLRKLAAALDLTVVDLVR